MFAEYVDDAVEYGICDRDLRFRIDGLGLSSVR
jgi:hypothetical protein